MPVRLIVMYVICFFVPVTHVEDVILAVFLTGAGKVGNYDCCSWQSLGNGQFRPLSGSDPFIGSVGGIEVLKEYKVEMVCADEFIQDAINALRKTHPYEEPAFQVTRLEFF